MPPLANLPSLSGVLAATIAAVEAEGVRLLQEFCLPGGPRGSGSKAPIDDEIELRLRQALMRAFPCRFVGEETGETAGSIEDWCWLVDPHDATSDFLKGRRGSAISVGLLHGSDAVLGVVHVPASPDRGRDTFAWAEGAGPPTRNGLPVRSDLRSGSIGAGKFVFATAGSGLRPVTFSRAVAPARFLAIASVAHRMARVAMGDGIATLSIHPVAEYDIAAGAALVRAAGGVVLDFGGSNVVFTGRRGAQVNGCFAGAPEAAAQLARFDWDAIRSEERLVERISTGFPKIADARRLARAQGCLLGQAIGDSLGSLVEFRSSGEIARLYAGGVRELADGGPWNTIAGQPTDDTEMALALARSMVAAGGYDTRGALEAYRAWIATAPADIGRTTRAALSGEPDGSSESNGSLMRASPLGIAAAGDPARAAANARADAALTHPNPVCLESGAAFAAAISAGVAGADPDAMLEVALAHCSGPAREVIARAASGETVRDFTTHPGWVLIALQNAFFHLTHAAEFESALVATVGAGNDSDTNGAIAGALLGASIGIQAIPRRWVRAVLSCRPLSEANAPRPRPMHYWPDDLLELAEALLHIAPRA